MAPVWGDTEAIYAGCLGREGDPCSVKVPNRHLFRVIGLCGSVRAFSGGLTLARAVAREAMRSFLATSWDRKVRPQSDGRDRTQGTQTS
jgi:hypothetical protein